MKNLLKSLALVAVSALAVVSCQKNELVSQNDGEGVFFSLRTADAGKTYIVADDGKYLPMWAEGNEIGVLFEGFAKDKTASDGKLENTNESGATAKFEGTIAGVSEGGNLYAFYPSKIATTYSDQTVGFDIVVNQKPTATSFDPAADLLISKQMAYSVVDNKVTIDGVQFARALSMLKINVYSSDFAGIQGQYLSKLTVTSVGKNIGGRPVFNLVAGDAKATKYNKTSESVSAMYDEEIVKVTSLKTTTGNSVFLMVAPVTIGNGTTLKFEGETSGYTISKEVVLTKDMVLTPGKLTEINLSLIGDNCKKKEVVDYSGDYLIVSGKHLLTDFNTGNYYNYVEAAGEELADFWEIAGIENYVWTVAKLADGNYSFYNAVTDKYLALTVDDNKAHQADNADENTARFNIAAEESALTIYSKAYPERKLRCNTSNPRFAFYGSTSSLPVASLLAYTPDLRPKFDVVSGLAWDASGKTLSWTAVEGATNGYEYTTDNGTSVVAVESNSVDCSSWTNGDYSVKVRVVGTDAKKTSEWSEACEFTITGGATASTLSFDFVTHPTGWPTAKADAAEGSYSYTLDNETYTFTHSKSGDGIYCGGTSGSSGYLMVAKNNTLGLPAISGYKLTKVVGTLNGSGSPSTKSEVSITDGTDVITGGASQTWNTKGGSYTYNLAGTEENTVYYLFVKNTANCQVIKIELTYEKTSSITSLVVSGTPTKTAYKAGDDFETAGLIATATYEDASEKDVTDDVEWTVTPSPLTAGTTSVSVVATYKKVSSTAYVVNGLTVTEPAELTSISVKTAPTKVEYIKGEKFDPTGLVISRNYSDKTSDDYAYADHESDFTFAPALTAVLAITDTKVTITYKEKSVDQAISVKSIANTKETAYTVAQARALIDAGKDLDTEVYVKGKISEIVTAYSSSYGNISFNVSDNGGKDGDQFQFYRNFKGANKTKWTDADTKPAVGNEVIGFGKLTKYGSTYEFAEGNYIVSITEAPYLNASASKTSVAAAGETVTITVDTNVDSWTVKSDNAAFVVGTKSGNTVPVVVSENTSTTNERTAHITVSATGVEDVVITLTQMKKGATKDYSMEYTSNVTLSTEGGTSASAAKVVIDKSEYDAIKAGTGKVQGVCVVTIPATTKTLHFHAAAWNGETVTLDVNGTEYSLVDDQGVSSNSPFTLKNDPAAKDYFTFDPKGATTITFKATKGNRFVLFGVNAD